MSPPSDTISESRVRGAGGENCQCMSASPTALSQKATCATRKSPRAEGLASAPDAKAIEPGLIVTPRKLQGLGPLHISFCNSASKTVVSSEAVLVNTQPVCEALTFWIIELVKVI